MYPVNPEAAEYGAYGGGGGVTGQPSGYAGKGGGTSSYASSCKRDTKIMTTITRVITAMNRVAKSASIQFMSTPRFLDNTRDLADVISRLYASFMVWKLSFSPPLSGCFLMDCSRYDFVRRAVASSLPSHGVSAGRFSSARSSARCSADAMAVVVLGCCLRAGFGAENRRAWFGNFVCPLSSCCAL